MAEVTYENVLGRLRARITYDIKASDLAREYGVSASYMSQVLKGTKAMNGAMLKSVGVVLSHGYQEIESRAVDPDAQGGET